MDSAHHTACRYYNLDRGFSVADLAVFHGHLGPYIVIGYRIGRYVREHFCDDPFCLKATVFCSGTTPQSCLADGVQLGSGCTLGKRNIEIVPADTIRCEFAREGTTLSLTPHPFTLPPGSGPEYEAAIEEIAERMYSMPDADLFEVTSR
ncbi:MAG TPA: formylmethanofuran dehydrogenase [Methanoculleus sp.]|nr:formylmethanofuran dehydrogenase [Methanoculleus sp.]